MTTVEVFAPAKINLSLHITGQRADGYHLLDSLVAFAPFGDTLTLQDGNALSLTVEGPEAAGVPADMHNLALQAAALVSRREGTTLVLNKSLPAASGIGGGSADAAAAFRGMLCVGDQGTTAADGLWSMPNIVIETHARALLALGADIHMCLYSKTCRVRGIGEKLSFAALPPLPALLVNPRVVVPTPSVFHTLTNPNNAPMPEVLPDFPDAVALIDWLCEQRNDLEAPAIEIASEIAELLSVLRATPDCRLARMSGSGATCFALYEDQASAVAAGRLIKEAHSDWWLSAGLLGDQSARALPKLS